MRILKEIIEINQKIVRISQENIEAFKRYS